MTIHLHQYTTASQHSPYPEICIQLKYMYLCCHHIFGTVIRYSNLQNVVSKTHVGNYKTTTETDPKVIFLQHLCNMRYALSRKKQLRLGHK